MKSQFTIADSLMYFPFLQIEELPTEITTLNALSRLCIQSKAGQSTIKRAPPGITGLPCWNEQSNPDYDLIRKLELYDHVRN